MRMTDMKFNDYYVEGVAVDQEWIVAHREYLEEELHKDMRSKGFIPVLDIPMNVTWEYDDKTGHFKYKLAAKGKGVGKKRSVKYLGILSDSGIMLSIDAAEAEVLV